MRCLNPLVAGQNLAGDITYNRIGAHKRLEFPCRKCIACRLNIGREKAIRCLHEARMHEENTFLTLTYSNENLKSDKLIIEDIQEFIQNLRDHTRQKNPNKSPHELRIPFMYTGEYGDENKRPHWHILLFNYWPSDSLQLRENKRGDILYTSKTIDEIWGKNDPLLKPNEHGEVTLDSAGYVGRYAAKKLIHGNDEDHDYHPIHNTSKKYVLGKSWIEKHWKRTFEIGNVTIPDGEGGYIPAKIPRYYVDWLKKQHPKEYEHYITNVLPKITEIAKKNARKEEINFFTQAWNRGLSGWKLITRQKVQETVLNSRFKKLQEKNSL